MISVRVYKSGGGNRGVPNKEVVVHGSMGRRSSRTDSTGTAHFDYKRGKYKIYVDGKIVHDGPVVDVAIVYI